MCCAGHLPFQAVLWAWLCPSSCPRPGSSSLVLIWQQVPQGYPQCMTENAPIIQLWLSLRTPHPPAPQLPAPAECPAQAAGRAPSQGLDAVLTSVLSRVVLLSDTLLTIPVPHLQDNHQLYVCPAELFPCFLFIASSG